VASSSVSHQWSPVEVLAERLREWLEDFVDRHRMTIAALLAIPATAGLFCGYIAGIV